MMAESKKKNLTPELQIDFLTGPLGYRLKHRAKEILTKAVGIKGNYRPTVIDATAGLGRDAVLLAHCGCSVVMLERSPVVAGLLADALGRLNATLPDDKKFALSLVQTDAKIYLQQLAEQDQPDVIYLDPMYPHRTKSALVKKEMRQLREIVGDDTDSQALLEIALKRAKNRIVVKRPRLAPTLSDLKPSFVITGKTQRFDVYLASSF